MPAEKTKYQIQELYNYSVDDSVTPPLMQRGQLVWNGTSWVKGGGFSLSPYDYVSRTLTNATTETYTFKTGGSGGTTTNTVVIVYTDSTLATISTVTKT